MNFHYSKTMSLRAYKSLMNKIAHNVVLSLYNMTWIDGQFTVFCSTQEQYDCVSSWMEFYN